MFSASHEDASLFHEYFTYNCDLGTYSCGSGNKVILELESFNHIMDVNKEGLKRHMLIIKRIQNLDLTVPESTLAGALSVVTAGLFFSSIHETFHT